MRLSEKENWKSFTAVEPMVLLKRATAMRLGWLQVSESRDVPESAPQPELPVAGGAKGVLSSTYLNIRFKLGVRLSCPLRLSFREIVARFKGFVQVLPQA